MSFADPPEPGDGECHSFTSILQLFKMKNKNFSLKNGFPDPIMLSGTCLCFPTPQDLRWNCYTCERMPKNATSAGVLSEMNWPEPVYRAQVRMVRQYFRIIKMDETRLTRKVHVLDKIFSEINNKQTNMVQ